MSTSAYLLFFVLLVPGSILYGLGVLEFAYRWPLDNHSRELLARIRTSTDRDERQYLLSHIADSNAALSNFDEDMHTFRKLLGVHSIGICLTCGAMALTLGFSVQTFALISLVLMLWFMSAMDVAYRVIPETPILLLASAGCLSLLLFDHSSTGLNSNVAMLSFATFSLILGVCLSLLNIWRFLRKREERLTIGSGDVLLALALCFWFGFDVLLITAIACLCMIVAQMWFALRDHVPGCGRPQAAFVYPFVPGLLVGVLVVLITPLSHWVGLNYSANMIAKQIATLL